MFAVPFDLGVIWINNEMKVVDLCVAKRWIGIRTPKAPARYILEVVPDRVSEFKIGDEIQFVTESE